MEALTETHLQGLPPPRRGKVRDVYDLGDTLLIVATDRISAFDHVLAPGVPDKGKILTQLSNFWFRNFSDIPNHLLETDAGQFPPELSRHRAILEGRSILARKCRVIPFECVARGYLAGSGWKDYCRTGAVCAIPLPPGLPEGGRLPRPIFTPATKAATGHDENVGLEAVAAAVGAELADELRSRTIAIYERVARECEPRGIIVADGKIEFGLGPREELVWIDEAYTPDSARFWPVDRYRSGSSPPSFDKQFVRDWLESTGWNKSGRPPQLPPEIVSATRERYLEAFRRITGREPEFI